MNYGKNIVTVYGPRHLLNHMHNRGFQVNATPDISGYIYVNTWSEMYFGKNIYVLNRTENSITISYKGYNGTFIPYLETLLLYYKKCFLKNQYTDNTKSETWMGRIKNGKVEVLTTEPDTEGIADFEIPY